MVMKSLEDAFVDELKDLLSAEKQLTRALPKLAKKATHPPLKQAFEEHLKQTEEHANRLEKAFESIGRSARSSKCEAMSGLVEEGEEAMKNDADPEVMDAILIAAAQKAEHYEIASYGTICTWGKLLGYDEAVKLLKQSLAEEKAADERLTKIAVDVNASAQSHDE